jgi:hypothetical protein
MKKQESWGIFQNCFLTKTVESHWGQTSIWELYNVKGKLDAPFIPLFQKQ